MPACYYGKIEGDISSYDFHVLVNRFAAETYGSPIFGPFNDQVLEFRGEDVTSVRGIILKNQGFEKIEMPNQSERNRDSNIANELADPNSF